jgi:hypothetical protein
VRIFSLLSAAVLAAGFGLLAVGPGAPGANAAAPPVLAVNTGDDLAWATGVCAAKNKSKKKCSLRAAITQANLDGTNDQITVPAITVTLSTVGGTHTARCEQLPAIVKSMSITGAGTTATVVNGMAQTLSGSTHCGVFEVGVIKDPSVQPILSVSRLRITGAIAGSGTALNVHTGSDVYLTDVLIDHNYAHDQAAGIRTNGNVTLLRTTIDSNNEFDGGFSGGGLVQSGGAIYNGRDMAAGIGGHVTIDRSTISNNIALRGSGVDNAGGTVDITNSTISGNRTLNGGGGVRNETILGPDCSTATSAGQVNISFSTITNNEAGSNSLPDWESGQLHNSGSDADARGGQFGGGLLNLGSHVYVPMPPCSGSPVVVPAPQVYMAATILAGNHDPGPPASRTAPDCFSPDQFAFTSAFSNLVGDVTTNCAFNTRFDIVGTPDHKIDPRLGPLQAAAGEPTATHALLPADGSGPASPAIDGVNFGPASGLPTCAQAGVDQRELPRPMDGTGDGTAVCDIGAYEVQATVPFDPPVICHGTGTLNGTYVYDLEEPCRQLTAGESGGDIWWEQIDDKRRQLVPYSGGVELALIGKRSVAQFDDISWSDLQSLPYTGNPINAGDSGNKLPDGTVFAVHTRSGHYAKVRVESHKYTSNPFRRDLKIRYTTYE